VYRISLDWLICGYLKGLSEDHGEENMKRRRRSMRKA
jgi:hypothetical protein